MTTRKPTIAQSIEVVKALAPEPTPPATIAILHLGHPSDPKCGTVEHMTLEEYKRFVWLHTWPRPRGAQGVRG